MVQLVQCSTCNQETEAGDMCTVTSAKLFTPMRLHHRVVKGKVTAGLADSNGSLLLGLWLILCEVLAQQHCHHIDLTCFQANCIFLFSAGQEQPITVNVRRLDILIFQAQSSLGHVYRRSPMKPLGTAGAMFCTGRMYFLAKVEYYHWHSIQSIPWLTL